ncbi:DUF2690 domain-containing protein [Kitasatospora sp. CM 4170]|uniref:DUF2690 domain-containing protein n=1 Tax=Kitasatospora aburaviensis TaxID=67265 RepID=A0ABW1ERH5_9ACTN|nr:DUF2690 domain-containing protein [Kitasatospora sp. CM 4170]WNM45678.1 DUF2690 domain-containing protein [Kitasatospora sp. CM 4170]
MASAWKELPDELSEPAARLTDRLRAVKDATGLSLSELATRTHYSRASWERWLNGKRVITEQALEALIGTVECDGPALRALWAQASAPAAVVAAEDGAEADAAGGAEAPEAGKATPVGEESAGSAADAGPLAAAGAGRPSAEADPAEEASSEETSGGEASAGEQGAGEPVAGEPAVEEPGAGPLPSARKAAPWWRRPVALVAGGLVLAVLLGAAGFRYSRGGAEEPPAHAQPAPTATAGTTTPAKPASPAPPGPSCQAMGCAHKDPKTTGCGADARTLQTGNIGKVVIYLRYSQKCQAAWAAITEGQPGDSATVTSSAGEVETALIHWGYDNYSMMVNAGDPATTFRVCGHQSAGDDCTGSVSHLAELVASTPIPIGPASPPAASPSPAGTSPAGAGPSTPAATAATTATATATAGPSESASS